MLNLRRSDVGKNHECDLTRNFKCKLKALVARCVGGLFEITSSVPQRIPDYKIAETMSKPPVILIVGMAGSGKTTFVQRLNSHLHTSQKKPYIMNLDPAVRSVPYGVNVDIRDTIDYKQVMKQYKLGPNGGILTSLNLFTTKFDQVMTLLGKRESEVSHILVDTPGQIEIFTWSASGAIITDALAASYPTILAYVIDTPRTSSPATFMSNMLYACSILYKTKLPMILVFNKTDVKDHEFAHTWMLDFEEFQAALRRDDESEEKYMNSLMNSMSLVLEEFYQHLDLVGVSAVSGSGMDDFMTAIEKKVTEYNADYKPMLEAAIRERQQQRDDEKQKSLDRLMADVRVDKATQKEKLKADEDALVVSDIEDHEGILDPDDSSNDDEQQEDVSLEQRYRERVEH